MYNCLICNRFGHLSLLGKFVSGDKTQFTKTATIHRRETVEGKKITRIYFADKKWKLVVE